ncbi:hypothetical protein ACFFOS_27440 [Nocardioides kongjuensis]|uniref:Uncharacterized protein n=1 Tax=Nocardioides kongjuensis TaxID=349522 RepID=A0A852RH35_9ACTN|nr:hypothetical protein [Nocardioides kongjuensis]NYD32687.1 hypothetical protein [Nocardioides kongjuensis]
MAEELTDVDELTADDFILGLFAALTRRNIPTVSMREEHFYEAIEASFRRLEELQSSDPGIAELTFRVKLDPLYGDSAVVRNAVNAVVQRTFLSLDNPEFVTIRSKLNDRQAERTLEHLPGKPEWYVALADKFVEVRTAAKSA